MGTDTDSDTLPVDSEEFHRTLVENAAEGMLTIDEDSRIVYANPAIEDVLGYTPEELVGSSKTRIVPERLRPVHGAALASYADTGERNIDWDGVELPALHKDGHEVPTLISLREHRHDGEQYFTGIVRDISDRTERERELRRRKDRLDEFADVLAHDIRNPLSVAQGYTELAREDHDAPDLDRVADALGRIEELIDDLLALSKEGARIGETAPVSLADCVRESWDGVDARDAELRIEAPLGTIEADRSRLRDLFGNLLRNAVEHGSADVTVTVGLLAHEADSDAGTPDGFYVADDGPGIPSASRAEIFDRGYSTQDGGTGYGLAIVHGIAEAHGWDVSIASASGGAGSGTDGAGSGTDGAGSGTDGESSDANGARFEFRNVEFVSDDA
ncbi:two-component system sensor histidine kinase NtrB [Halopenitus persicus]|uniref:two-component system sensor histidine kinase NtrB n=1 Tax=Halopenitus persicus TaxID=1048396 RepID=UPI000BBA81E1|nr:PAS domain-containing sensor histidine kinase [Halopenitus persicus]